MTRLTVLGGIWGLGFTALLFRGPLGLSTPTSSLSTYSETLTCNDVERLAQWSLRQHGNRDRISLSETNWAAKVAKAFVKKLDPGAVFFLDSEVKELEDVATQAWTSGTFSSFCPVFKAWYSRRVSFSRSRFSHLLASIPNSSFYLNGVSSPSRTKVVTFENSGFAANESQLGFRQASYLKSLIQTTDPRVLKAYGAHRKRLLQDTLEENDGPVRTGAMIHLAKAILGSFDKYSTYYSKEEFEDFSKDLSGADAGIGVQVGRIPEGILVEKVLPDSPAKKAQIQEGDKIVGINGTGLEGLSLAEMSRLLSGPQDAALNLDIVKRESSERHQVSIHRSALHDEEMLVNGRVIPSKYDGEKTSAVITIPSFYGRSPMEREEARSVSEDFKAEMQKLFSKAKQPSALVLDLRGNPGGFLEEAVSVASIFVGEKPSVAVAEPESVRVLSESETSTYEGPLVVLVDAETASAGEVLAGALKDYRRAILVGTKSTYGKGSVQRLYQLDDPFLRVGVSDIASAGVLRVTTSYFYSPMGHTPANGGVVTDIVLDADTQSENTAASVVADRAPLIDENILDALKAGETSAQSQLEKLRFHSQERTAGKSLDISTEAALQEAVEIALELR